MIEEESIFEVRGYELDSFGHLNNSVYLNYLEAERWNFCKKYILKYKDGKYQFEDNLFLVIIETYIKYIRELRLFDRVIIKSKYSCEGDIIVGEYVLVKEGEKTKIAISKSKLVFVDHDRVLHSIPKELKNLLES